MVSLRYDVVDVFTADGPHTGNPLAVVHGGDVLSTARMQTIAAEFGLSETAFPLAPTARRVVPVARGELLAIP